MTEVTFNYVPPVLGSWGGGVVGGVIRGSAADVC